MFGHSGFLIEVRWNLEIGKKYKVVYRDDEYSKILTATLIHIEEHLLSFENSRDGLVIIGKSSIVQMREV